MKPVTSAAAPQAIGPYSQAIDLGDFVFISGQLPIDASTGNMPGDVTAQTRQALANLRHILTACGLDMKNVVKTTVFLQKMDDFAAMNQVYGEHFSEPYPARAAVEVAKLPKQALVEIEAIAKRG